MSLPPHIRFLALHALAGALAGSFVAGLLLLADAGGLATLIGSTGSPIAPLALLFGGFIITFASLAMGSAIMLLPRQE
jgi:hypothetical protein